MAAIKLTGENTFMGYVKALKVITGIADFTRDEIRVIMQHYIVGWTAAECVDLGW